MAINISNMDDLIDSRQIMDRIVELEELDERAEDEQAELTVLKSLEEQAQGYADDWTHGETLIRDSYFEDYAQEQAEDRGMIKSDAGWPYTCIDWEQAARELQMDYTSVDFDGVTYWVR